MAGPSANPRVAPRGMRPVPWDGTGGADGRGVQSRGTGAALFVDAFEAQRGA
jgi:hypothetical protein